MNDPGEPRLKAFRPPAPRAEREGGEREKKKEEVWRSRTEAAAVLVFLFFFVNLSSLFSLRRPNETGPWGGKAVAGRREGEGTGCCES
jgi:hypothetical protein